MPLSGGAVFAGYRIERLLGSGAMGEVYLARHPRLPRHDALKVLSGALTADDEFRQRFQLEAEVAATLFHPDIVGVHDRAFSIPTSSVSTIAASSTGGSGSPWITSTAPMRPR